ncbi:MULTISPECIES: hypothetical protein [Bacillus]|uniref:Uncharacterized protein n=1 Tax=Bacillus capparidis TaxID=1840411 RepID=A0ABS4CUM1_9BACI|nr:MULTISPECIES: hypothetical protein [Bacillus]MBP1081275.1 hypothetical protein [Bacillus capparidis]MED1095954.1 hypothetical protein [Bacillus capparidis]
MNNFQWINTLLNRGNSRKRNNGMMLWVSVLGLVSAVFFGLRGSRSGNMMSPVQNFFSNLMQNKNLMRKPVPVASKTEFSNELTPNKK